VYNTETGAMSEMSLLLDLLAKKEDKVYATGTYTSGVLGFVGDVFEVFSGKTGGGSVGMPAVYEQEIRPVGLKGYFDVTGITLQADVDEDAMLNVILIAIDEEGTETSVTDFDAYIVGGVTGVPFGPDTAYQFDMNIPDVWRLKVRLEDRYSAAGTAVNAINFVSIDFVDRNESLRLNTPVYTP